MTRLLEAAATGDAEAERRIFDVVYDELRRMAAGHTAKEAAGGSLRATDLVHEAYLRLCPGGKMAPWAGRAHFFGAASEAMRRILIERARSRKRLKRGGGMARVDLDSAAATLDTADPTDVVAIDDALSRLEAFDPRGAEIVKMRCFIGMSIAEVATALGLSSRTINRDWLAAKAWLKSELAAAVGEGESRSATGKGA